MRGFFRFVLAMLLMLVVAMSAALVTMHFAIHGAEVAVPDFRGMTIPEAGRRAAANHLEMHLENRLYSEEIPEGRISRQSPAAGTLVRHGWRVWLTESLGPQKIKIPNEVGKDQRIAAIEVRRAGLQLGFVADLPWPSAQPGMVIAQSPPPNATGIARPSMNLLVAAAAPPAMEHGYVMPSLIGEPFATAALALTRAGLQQAPVQELPISQPMPGAPPSAAPLPAPGTVVAQNPPAGYRVDATTPIMLTVAQ
jgi:beta-lactam-binding protein with PASTA domain